jgi:hypothetical protein
MDMYTSQIESLMEEDSRACGSVTSTFLLQLRRQLDVGRVEEKSPVVQTRHHTAGAGEVMGEGEEDEQRRGVRLNRPLTSAASSHQILDGKGRDGKVKLDFCSQHPYLSDAKF